MEKKYNILFILLAFVFSVIISLSYVYANPLSTSNTSSAEQLCLSDPNPITCEQFLDYEISPTGTFTITYPPTGQKMVIETNSNGAVISPISTPEPSPSTESKSTGITQSIQIPNSSSGGSPPYYINNDVQIIAWILYIMIASYLLFSVGVDLIRREIVYAAGNLVLWIILSTIMYRLVMQL